MPPMTLDEWLRQTHTKQRKFAALIGRDASTVSRLRRRETLPDQDTLRAIHKATKGQVTANDFYGVK